MHKYITLFDISYVLFVVIRVVGDGEYALIKPFLE